MGFNFLILLNQQQLKENHLQINIFFLIIKEFKNNYNKTKKEYIN